jgi:S1-C subfamily serine protease
MTTNNALVSFSTALADLAAAGGATVIQVQGGRRAISGVVHGSDTVVTSARAIGREDRLQVTLPAGNSIAADLTGWDPATGIAVLRSRGALELPVPSTADNEPRVGQLVLALARSWSNALTASAGTVAVVGGPLRTGRRREISRVIRITASVHDGFAGGGVFDAEGRLTGIATAASIRGFGVVIPASIAWDAARQVLTSGTPQRGFVGVGVQPVTLSDAQRAAGTERALLVVSITPSSPAEAGGLLVGDILLRFDDQSLEHPEDLLDLLTERRIGQTAAVRILRGNSIDEKRIAVGRRD